MAAIYSKLNKKSIETAINKAKAVKPLVKVNGFNDFTVTGSKGEKYTVSFTGKGVDFTGNCTCKANQGNKVCYHVAAVAIIYKQQVNERAASAAPIACCAVCGKPTENHLCGACVAQIESEIY